MASRCLTPRPTVTIRRLCAFLVLLPLAACVSVAVLSDEEINEVSLQVFEAVIAKSEIITSGAQYEMVQRVGRKIVEATELDLPWQVKLLKADNTRNSFSLPGGRIVIYSGILPITENESGLAVVIGHEMAHAVLHHGGRRIADIAHLKATLVAIKASACMTNMCPEAQQGVLSAFGRVAQDGPSMPSNDNHEAEADELGLRYAIRAGYDPWEAPKLWERMARYDSTKSVEWNRSHPESQDRAVTLRALIPRLVTEEAGWQPKQKNGG
jgi:metalloendopeptidase OMA1, mitochondrial